MQHIKQKRKEKKRKEKSELIPTYDSKIQVIAYNFRPHINRPVVFEENKAEYIDMLRCAILKKWEEQNEINEILWWD